MAHVISTVSLNFHLYIEQYCSVSIPGQSLPYHGMKPIFALLELGILFYLLVYSAYFGSLCIMCTVNSGVYCVQCVQQQ